MKTEIISGVKLSEIGDLRLQLASGGNSSYQYVYRAASGVHWDPENRAFKFATKNDGQCAKWFVHIVKVAESEIGLHLRLGADVTWDNVSDAEKDAMKQSKL